MNKVTTRLLSVSLTLWSLSSSALSIVLSCNPQERLSASIASNAMNRLAVHNDRILNLFGDEGAFVTQHDEQNGQVFIKPAQINQQPLSLSVVTENGLTQDLRLVPDALEPSTIILEPRTPVESEESVSVIKANRTVEEIIGCLKGTLLKPELIQRKSVRARTVSGFQLQYQQSFVKEGCCVEHWHLQNTSPHGQAVLEKNLYQPGDRALSVKKAFLNPLEKTSVYVLKVAKHA